jgi:hypothetical protein
VKLVKAFWNIIKHRYFKFAAIVSVLLILPIILFSAYQTQELRGKAETGTTLYFSPTSSKASPVIKAIGEAFYLDLMLNPGKNLVSFMKVDIRYDSSVLSLSPENQLVVNDVVFPQILEGPVYTDGRIQIVLSVGQDYTKAISTEIRALTLNFVAKSRTSRTSVDIGNNTAVYSVGSADFSEENVFSSYTPGYLKIINSSNTISETPKDNPGKGNKK